MAIKWAMNQGMIRRRPGHSLYEEISQWNFRLQNKETHMLMCNLNP